MSESRIAFTQALIEARNQFGDLVKDKRGHFAYASITAIKRAIDKPLAANGITYSFEVSVDPQRVLWLVVEHVGGDKRVSGYPLFENSNDRKDANQAYGANLTYGMRNLLRTFFCLDADDDDPDNYNPETGEVVQPQMRANSNNKVSEKQLYLINRLIRDKNKDLAQIVSYYKVESLTDLNAQQASELITRLK